jgi:hypothetical protein
MATHSPMRRLHASPPLHGVRVLSRCLAWPCAATSSTSSVRSSHGPPPKIRHPPTQRVLTDLFGLVFLEGIGAEMLHDVVEPEPLFAALPDAARLVAAAFKHHALPPARRSPARLRRTTDHRITWNASDKHEWVRLSEDRLEVGYNGSGELDDHQEGINGMVRATRGWTTGRRYFEFSLLSPREASGEGYPSVGVVAADVPLSGDDEHVIGGSHGRGWGYNLSRMSKVHAGNHYDDDVLYHDTIHESTDETRFGLLLDIEAATLQLYVNGELKQQSTHTGVRGVGPLYAAAEAGTLSVQRLRFNFGATRPQAAGQ